MKTKFKSRAKGKREREIAKGSGLNGRKRESKRVR
jgi:hypothetical protein